jgi:hypothetical protein
MPTGADAGQAADALAALAAALRERFTNAATLWGSITGSGLVRLSGWDHR